MQAILYIGHGSRVEKARNQAAWFIKQCMGHQLAQIQEISFLELSHPTIKEGINRCIERGATRIAVVPVLLLEAGHAKRDIPLELDRIQGQFPDVMITYGRPLGVHSKIVDILIERIYDQGQPINDAMVLLVGRGSSDPNVKRDLDIIARRLNEKHSFRKVETCYLAAAKPSFEEGIEEAKIHGHQQVYVVPYLLFTGILMQRMEKTIHKLSVPDQAFVLCEFLGYHSNLQKVVRTRAMEAVRGAL